MAEITEEDVNALVSKHQYGGTLTKDDCDKFNEQYPELLHTIQSIQIAENILDAIIERIDDSI